MNEEDKGRIDRLRDSLYSRTKSQRSYERHELSPEEEEDVQVSGPEDAASDTPIEDVVSFESLPHPVTRIMQKIFVGSIIFFVAAAVFAGVMFLRGGGAVSPRNIDINLAGPTTVAAGAPIEFNLSLLNRNNVVLENAVLKIDYPQGARSTDERNAPLSSETIELGQMSPGREIVRDVNMVLFGERGAVEKLGVTLEYRVPGSNSVFVARKDFDVAIGFAPIVATVNYPSNINAGDELVFVVEIVSNSTEIIHDVLLSAEYPFGFSFGASSPEPYVDDNLWRLGDIPSGEKRTITIRGRLEAQDEEERSFRFLTGVADSANPRRVQSVLVSSLETVRVARPFLAVSSRINGADGEVYAARPGERLSVSINWRNNFSQPALNATIEARLRGSFDGTTVVPRMGGFFRSSDSTVIWQRSGLAALGEIAPGSTGSVDFSVGLPASFGSSGANQSLVVEIVMRANVIEQGGSTRPIETRVSKLARPSAAPNLAVFSGRGIGIIEHRGPMPPRVNQETTYSLFFAISNNSADLNGVEVRGVLPPYVEWKSAFSPASERIIYNPATREVVWTAGSVPAGTGGNLPERRVEFQVGLTPSISQVSTVPILIEDVALTGTDILNGRPVSVRGANPTTRTADTPFVEGHDRVAE